MNFAARALEDLFATEAVLGLWATAPRVTCRFTSRSCSWFSSKLILLVHPLDCWLTGRALLLASLLLGPARLTRDLLGRLSPGFLESGTFSVVCARSSLSLLFSVLWRETNTVNLLNFNVLSQPLPFCLFTSGNDKLNCLKEAPKIYLITKRNS